LRSLGIQPEV